MSEISLEFATTQIARLSGLPNWPRFDEARLELVNALRTTARSEAHAKNAIDELVRSARCPTPDEVIRTTWGLLTDDEYRQCARCGGSGWVHTERIISGVRYDFSAPCRKCRGAVAPDAAQQTSSKRKRAGSLQPAATRNMFGGGEE